MTEFSKSEILLNDLNSVETQVAILINNCKDLNDTNTKLQLELEKSNQEISELKTKIVAFDTEISNLNKNNPLSNSFDVKERENLKLKLQGLITRLDYYISS